MFTSMRGVSRFKQQVLEVQGTTLAPKQRVWIKRGDVSHIFMLYVAYLHTFHFPSVILCKGRLYMKIFSGFSSILFGIFWIKYFYGKK